MQQRATAARTASVTTHPLAGEPLARRPTLPLPYLAVLLAETAGLAALAATGPAGRPPLAYPLGWVGLASMVLAQGYSLRRRIRALGRLGSLPGWLAAHIFLGCQGALFVLYHSLGAALRPSLAMLGLATVAAIVLTGLAGRTCYGLLWIAQLEGARAHAALGVAARRRCRGLPELVARALPRPFPATERGATLREARRLDLRLAVLEVAELWCSRWALVHRPLAVLLAAVVTLHVLAHYAYAS